MKYFVQFMVILVIAVSFSLAGSDKSDFISGVPLFAVCVGFAFVLQWLVFVPSYVAQTEHYFDLTGSLTYLSILAIAVILGNPGGLSLLLSLLVAVWAIRLGSFLFMRVKRAKGDKRFEQKNIFGWFFIAWTLQGLWVVLTSGAALVVITGNEQPPINSHSMPGLFLWLVGFAIEVTADRQKSRFRAIQANKGRFIRHGLWAYSRHPNYFGEILIWIGIAAIALPALDGWQYVSLISPLFVWVLLRYISGVPFLEGPADRKWGDEPEYQRYVQTTPAIFPRLKVFR